MRVTAPPGTSCMREKGRFWPFLSNLVELRVTGTPVPVLNGVTVNPDSGNADYSLSRDGTLLYAPGDAWGNTNRVVWVDRQGRTRPLIDTPGFYVGPQLSPDGRLLAITKGGANGSNWVYDLERHSMTPVASGWDNVYAHWTLDGRNLTFASNRSGVYNLYQQAADGSSEAERLTFSDHRQSVGSWSPDGKVIAFRESSDIWLLSMDGEPKRELFLQTEFSEWWPRFSPDGRWIAYVSNPSGQDEIYVRPFPRSEGRQQVSVEGGMLPEWNPSGGELFYINGEKMMVAEVATSGETITFSNPRLLLERPLGRGDYDVSSDGQNFVMIEQGELFAAPTRLRLIMNWSEELKRLAPTGN